MGRGPDRNNETADVLYINIGIGLHQSCSCLKPLYAYLRRISNRMQRRKTQLLYSDTSYSDTSGMIVFTLIAELTLSFTVSFFIDHCRIVHCQNNGLFPPKVTW